MAGNQEKQNHMSTTIEVASAGFPSHSQPNASQEPDRAARLRENKRRSRARQKEYVESLEKRHRETQQQQVEATIEVQVAARKVADENRRLRELLTMVGVPNEIVNRWVLGEEVHVYAGDTDTVSKVVNRWNMNCRERDESCATNTEQVVGQMLCTLETPEYTATNTNDESVSVAITGGDILSVELTCEGEMRNCQDSQLRPTSPASTTVLAQCSPIPTDPSTAPDPLPPCKTLSTLSIDPAAGYHNPSTQNDTRGEGVQCSQAYRMLVPYATTEEKMNELATRLEKGCVADGKGGCRVRTEVVWGALDDVCLE